MRQELVSGPHACVRIPHGISANKLCRRVVASAAPKREKRKVLSSDDVFIDAYYHAYDRRVRSFQRERAHSRDSFRSGEALRGRIVCESENPEETARGICYPKNRISTWLGLRAIKTKTSMSRSYVRAAIVFISIGFALSISAIHERVRVFRTVSFGFSNFLRRFPFIPIGTPRGRENPGCTIWAGRDERSRA